MAWIFGSIRRYLTESCSMSISSDPHLEPGLPYMAPEVLAQYAGESAVEAGRELPKTAYIAIDTILLHPHNWHIHPQEQLEAIRASIEYFGPDMDPSDYNVRTGHLLDGHARLAVLRERG